MPEIIKRFSRSTIEPVALLTIIISLVVGFGSSCFAGQCSEPPFVSASMIPNVMLVLDNSASMYDLAYVGENPQESYCYDDSYQSPYDAYEAVPGKTYYGYYEPETWYHYNQADSRFEQADGPSTDCTNISQSRSDYCVKTADNQLVHAFFRGNVLNWMTMSKLDVEKKVLTGGKYDGTVLMGESRGCLGRRFIKEVKSWVQKGSGNSKKYELHSTGIVFAVRGPNASDGSEFTSLFDAGETAIEIYTLPDPDDTSGWEGSMEACIEAVQQFCDTTDHGGFGQAQNNIKECLGYKPGVGADKWESDPGKEQRYGFAAFLHSVHICWHLNPAHSPGRPTPTPGDMQSIMSICEGQYAHLTKDYGFDEGMAMIADPLDPSFICSKYGDPGNEIGIGWCYTGNGTDHGWGDPDNLDADDPADLADTEDCVRHQLLSFCSSSELPLVVDPSEEFGFCGSSDDSFEYGYIPAMIIESGVLSQLTEDGEPTATMQNKRSSDAPTGLLQKVKSKVKLGLMLDNQYGSAFEFTDADRELYGCTNEDADGGRVVSPLTLDNDDIISSINDSVASNWTPLGETFYELTRYFRGMTSAYLAGESYACPVDDFCQSNNVVLISDSYSTRDKNVPGTGFGSATVEDPGYDAESVLAEIGVDNDFEGTLPLDGTTYAVAAAYWAHTFDGKWAGGENENPNDKNLNFYSIFALGGDPPPNDQNLLRYIAKYGGFVDGNSNNLPDDGEWDGHNYVEAKDAYHLESALTQIFYEISAVGAAGAVATVTQEMESDDLLVRGGFETDDPSTSNIDWKGHLEVYIPYEGCSSYSTQPECENIAGCSWFNNSCTGSMYSFQKPSNWGKFCSESDTTNGYCWDGGMNIPAYDSRDIFTFINGTQLSLTQANAAALQPYMDNDIDFQELDCLSKDQSACTDTDGCWWNETECQPTAGNLINWIRGDTTYDGSTVRDRNGWILGDIVYSTPVVVGAPSLASVDPSIVGSECSSFMVCRNLSQTDCASNAYCEWDTGSTQCVADLSNQNSGKCFYTFRETNLTRKKVVYAGANDGMLHAFVVGKFDSSQDKWLYKPSEDSEIGKELWAYIPSNFLSELKELARLSYGNDPGCKHRFMVDLSSQAWDVFIDHDDDGSREWRTVILGGERGGGDVYFALDVTDPDNPIVLWEYSPIRNLLQVAQDGSYSFAYNHEDYEKIKTSPTSWSMPYAGRLNISSAVTFPVNSVAPLNPQTPAVDNYVSQNASDRWFAFVGGGFRIFESTSIHSPPVDLTPLQKPNLFAIDIETGNNILQYAWPKIQNAFSSEWPTQQVGDYQIPYAMANTVAFDLWGLNGQNVRTTYADGAVDHIFVGDLSGLLWGLRVDPAASFGLQIDLWETKNVSTGAYGYRGSRQPLTVTAAAALDGSPGAGTLNVHLYYGTGKFDDIDGPQNDKNDAAVMSFYGLSLPLTSVSASGTSATITVGSSTSFTAHLNRHGCATDCPGTTDDWVTVAGQSCCYECLLDFIATGERVVDSALVASEMVFFTTFIPDMDTSCSAGGDAYLYAVDYLCRNLSMDPFAESGLSSSWLGDGGWSTGNLPDGQQAKVFRARVGAGMPSRPILDSSGRYLFVQTSDARIHKIKVKLPGNPLTVKGWKEEN